MTFNKTRASFDRLYDAIRDGDIESMRDMMRLSTERRTLFDKP